jgi:hypothetical protein
MSTLWIYKRSNTVTNTNDSCVHRDTQREHSTGLYRDNPTSYPICGLTEPPFVTRILWICPRCGIKMDTHHTHVTGNCGGNASTQRETKWPTWRHTRYMESPRSTNIHTVFNAPPHSPTSEQAPPQASHHGLQVFSGPVACADVNHAVDPWF